MRYRYDKEGHVIYTLTQFVTTGRANREVDKLKKQLDEEGNSTNNNHPLQQKMVDKIHQLARKSSQILLRIKTVFPFDFFPDTLTINANKIDVVKSDFFFSQHTTSIPLRDIANVEVETAPFFAKLQIINVRYPMEPVSLQYLPKAAALKAKRIIDGLLVAMSQGADVAVIEPKKLLPQLEKVGGSAMD
ncbi:MAG TPA: hypothetical protein VE090_03775 [Methylomirabilota bacterium]|nr:hypothetical protein [Methylomirabilota bacterium]